MLPRLLFEYFVKYAFYYVWIICIYAGYLLFGDNPNSLLIFNLVTMICIASYWWFPFSLVHYSGQIKDVECNVESGKFSGALPTCETINEKPMERLSTCRCDEDEAPPDYDTLFDSTNPGWIQTNNIK